MMKLFLASAASALMLTLSLPASAQILGGASGQVTGSVGVDTRGAASAVGETQSRARTEVRRAERRARATAEEARDTAEDTDVGASANVRASNNTRASQNGVSSNSHASVSGS